MIFLCGAFRSFTERVRTSRSSAPNLFPSIHNFDVVAIWIENECGIVAGRAMVNSAYKKGSLIEGINLPPALSAKSCVLLDTVRVEDINPEHGVVNTVWHSTRVAACVF